jgi:two-component SAPR family response regulator
MKVIIVDNDVSNLEVFGMETKMEGQKSIEVVGSFQSPKEALEFVKGTPVDLAILNTEMPEHKKLEFERQMQESCEGITIICNNKCEKKTTNEKKVYIRTFGRFEIFVNGQPIELSSHKAKELLALLVDRKGSIVTTEEMIAYLLEDRPNDERSRNYCRKIIQRMHEGLKEYEIDDIVIRHKRGRSLNIEKVECDYYKYLDENKDKKGQFRGEYMTNYSWAEESLAGLMW